MIDFFRKNPELDLLKWKGHLSLQSLKKREHSSAGSEHLPYKQRVRGSNPCAPTDKLLKVAPRATFAFIAGMSWQICRQFS